MLKGVFHERIEYPSVDLNRSKRNQNNRGGSRKPAVQKMADRVTAGRGDGYKNQQKGQQRPAAKQENKPAQSQQPHKPAAGTEMKHGGKPQQNPVPKAEAKPQQNTENKPEAKRTEEQK